MAKRDVEKRTRSYLETLERWAEGKEEEGY
jgi:hypothetical protein